MAGSYGYGLYDSWIMRPRGMDFLFFSFSFSFDAGGGKGERRVAKGRTRVECD